MWPFFETSKIAKINNIIFTAKFQVNCKIFKWSTFYLISNQLFNCIFKHGMKFWHISILLKFQKKNFFLDKKVPIQDWFIKFEQKFPFFLFNRILPTFQVEMKPARYIFEYFHQCGHFSKLQKLPRSVTEFLQLNFKLIARFSRGYHFIWYLINFLTVFSNSEWNCDSFQFYWNSRRRIFFTIKNYQFKTSSSNLNKNFHFLVKSNFTNISSW